MVTRYRSHIVFLDGHRVLIKILLVFESFLIPSRDETLRVFLSRISRSGSGYLIGIDRRISGINIVLSPGNWISISIYASYIVSF